MVNDGITIHFAAMHMLGVSQTLQHGDFVKNLLNILMCEGQKITRVFFNIIIKSTKKLFKNCSIIYSVFQKLS